MASTGEAWRLGRRPALDGVRGLAILLVLLCHTLVWPLSQYGEEGVDLFFTLSGFLITTLLLEEWQRAGRIDLRAFYVRRARRLLPALVFLVLVVTAVRLLGPRSEDGLTAAAAVLGYVGNWAASQGVDLGYLGHGWSLAVEEQFYILWPGLLLLMVKAPRRWWVAAMVAAVGLVCCWRWWVYSNAPVPDLGSLMRAAPLLIGCGLAFWLHARPEGRSHPRVAVVLLAGLLASPWLPLARPLEHVPAGLLAAGLILCSCRRAGVRWLEWGPLRLVGRRSYGLYLWHYPVMMPVVVLPLTGWVRVAVIVTAVGVSWAMALVSWRFVEAPMLAAGPREARGLPSRLGCPSLPTWFRCQRPA